ncbi:hypothetical protein O4_69 [Pseudomonas phage O4]|uniref:hypothetical protein n=1 Tax=Pseudomonas phage O4 TaxID=1784982 RepID=UPI00078DE37C|nr:hypothetical protein BJD45_gp73 [Pseudomonas phage O4]AMO43544.1 hypothetical protein O4_69 [Pseudomonas phage O4]
MKDYVIMGFMIVGLSVGALVAGNIQGHNLAQKEVEEHFGFSVGEGKKYKEQCEANLPRNVHCETVVLYVPQNEQ